MSLHVVILGATGRTGRLAVAGFCAAGHRVTAIGRSPDKLDLVDARADRHAVAMADRDRLAPLLANADAIVACNHAQYTGDLLAALPPRDIPLVLMGSVRRYLPIPDHDGALIAQAEAIFTASGRSGVMLHASMIYGAPADGNVGRLRNFLRRLPPLMILPLPDGGRHLVQPIHVDDVVRCLIAAVDKRVTAPPLILAGPRPFAYAELIRQVARSVGRRVAILPVPVGLLAGIATLAARIGLRLPFKAAELRRAGADKNFDITPMRDILGVEPMDFSAGLIKMAGKG